VQTETERGHWHAVKSLVRVGWWRLAASFFRRVKYLTHWHGKTGLAANMLAAMDGSVDRDVRDDR
jgi:hypothetical protein